MTGTEKRGFASCRFARRPVIWWAEGEEQADGSRVQRHRGPAHQQSPANLLQLASTSRKTTDASLAPVPRFLPRRAISGRVRGVAQRPQPNRATNVSGRGNSCVSSVSRPGPQPPHPAASLAMRSLCPRQTYRVLDTCAHSVLHHGQDRGRLWVRVMLLLRSPWAISKTSPTARPRPDEKANSTRPVHRRCSVPTATFSLQFQATARDGASLTTSLALSWKSSGMCAPGASASTAKRPLRAGPSLLARDLLPALFMPNTLRHLARRRSLRWQFVLPL